MNIQYLFSSPQGDMPLEPAQLALPFRITPNREHPSLTLGDYFDGLGQFLCMDDGRRLMRLIEKELSQPIESDQIRCLRLYSEKHGALYHIARVVIGVGDRSLTFAAIAAVSPGARAQLAREYDVLESLQRNFDFDYLPKVYYRGDIVQQTGRGEVHLSFLLAQWFEEYHEWHLTPDEKSGTHRVCIWDQDSGHRLASRHETFEIFRQGSRILTLYYDPGTYSQIYPWHHAAGDFVVRSRGEDVLDMKLTTARGYAPVMAFPGAGQSDSFIALTYFFLNLTVKMRLDKSDGTGAVVWAQDPALEACTRGFFQALACLEDQGRPLPCSPADVSQLFTSFDTEEITGLYQPLLDFYREEEPEYYPVIQRHHQEHARELYQVIQRFRTGDPQGGC